jgi:membrane associated rhomboid family serine protease
MLPLSDGIPVRRFPIVNVLLIEANFGLFNAHANGGGVAFFAHVGGFIFGLLTARLLARAGQAAPRGQRRSTA